jgi:hypothetical protein
MFKDIDDEMVSLDSRDNTMPLPCCDGGPRVSPSLRGQSDGRRAGGLTVSCWIGAWCKVIGLILEGVPW